MSEYLEMIMKSEMMPAIVAGITAFIGLFVAGIIYFAVFRKKKTSKAGTTQAAATSKNKSKGKSTPATKPLPSPQKGKGKKNKGKNNKNVPQHQGKGGGNKKKGRRGSISVNKGPSIETENAHENETKMSLLSPRDTSSSSSKTELLSPRQNVNVHVQNNNKQKIGRRKSSGAKEIAKPEIKISEIEKDENKEIIQIQNVQKEENKANKKQKTPGRKSIGSKEDVAKHDLKAVEEKLENDNKKEENKRDNKNLSIPVQVAQEQQQAKEDGRAAKKQKTPRKKSVGAKDAVKPEIKVVEVEKKQQQPEAEKKQQPEVKPAAVVVEVEKKQQPEVKGNRTPKNLNLAIPQIQEDTKPVKKQKTPRRKSAGAKDIVKPELKVEVEKKQQPEVKPAVVETEKKVIEEKKAVEAEKKQPVVKADGNRTPKNLNLAIPQIQEETKPAKKQKTPRRKSAGAKDIVKPELKVTEEKKQQPEVKPTVVEVEKKVEEKKQQPEVKGNRTPKNLNLATPQVQEEIKTDKKQKMPRKKSAGAKDAVKPEVKPAVVEVEKKEIEEKKAEVEKKVEEKKQPEVKGNRTPKNLNLAIPQVQEETKPAKKQKTPRRKSAGAKDIAKPELKVEVEKKQPEVKPVVEAEKKQPEVKGNRTPKNLNLAIPQTQEETKPAKQKTPRKKSAGAKDIVKPELKVTEEKKQQPEVKGNRTPKNLNLAIPQTQEETKPTKQKTPRKKSAGAKDIVKPELKITEEKKVKEKKQPEVKGNRTPKNLNLAIPQIQEETKPGKKQKTPRKKSAGAKDIVKPELKVTEEKKQQPEVKPEKKEIEEPQIVSDDADKEVEFKPKRHSSASPVKEKNEVPIELATTVVRPPSQKAIESIPPVKPATEAPAAAKEAEKEDTKKSTSGTAISFPSVAARRKSFQFKPLTKPPERQPIVIEEPKEEKKAEPKKDDKTATTTSEATASAAPSHLLTHVKKAPTPTKRRPTRNPLKDRKQQEESGVITSTTSESETTTAAAAAAAGTPSSDAKKENSLKRVNKRAATMIGGFGVLYSAKAEAMDAAEALRSRVSDDSDDYFKKKQEEKGLVLPREKSRLFQIQGKSRPFACEVERSWTSFRANCSYILDPGKNGRFLYQWNGNAASRIVKGKAMDLAKNLHDKERFSTKVVLVAQGEETPEFFAELCGKGAGKPEGWDDMPRIPGTPKEIEEMEKAHAQAIRLKRVIYDEATGTSELEDLDVHGKTLVKGILNDKECFVLDCDTEVYSWVPLKVKTKYKNEAVRLAEEIATKRREEDGGTRWVAPVYHEWAGNEQVLFRERFFDWNTVAIGVSAGPAVKFQKKELPSDYFNVDVAKLYDNQSLTIVEDKKLATMIDSTVTNTANDKITIFIVEEFKRISIPPEDFGHFYSGETYLILYQYVWKNKDCHIIYFWQGKNSSVLGKGTSAALTKELDDKMKLNACMSLEVRVVQGKEPQHFVSLFKDKFVVHQGMDPHSSVSKPLPTNVPRMYHIEKKRLDYHISAVQMKDFSARILNSWNTFVFTIPANESAESSAKFNKKEGYAYIWNGKFATEDEQKYGLSVVERLRSVMKFNEVVVVKEGEEPEEFWTDLGGKFEYPTQTFTSRYYPRFYHCSVSTGKYKVDEVVNFTQEDLEQSMAVIFDVYYAIYVWIGSKAHQHLKRHTFETAQSYLKHAASVDKRPENIPILRVQESEEPMVFSVYFQGWQMRPVKKGLPIPVQTYNNGLVSAEDVLKDYNRKYSYDDLVNKRYPPGLDETALENYLEDAEFESVFGCNREAFNKLSSWQKRTLKQQKKLF